MIECTRCGWCCSNLPIPLTFNDIMEYQQSGQIKILQEISYIDNYPKKGTGGFYFAKTTFNPKQACPFLDSNMDCSIHTHKPKTCEDYPYGAKKYPNCVLSCALQPNPRRANEIKTTQYSDFEKAHNMKDLLLKILIVSRY